MSQEEIFINGELLRSRREASSWAINDMAIRACLSVKQVRQLEDGGMSSFYSQSVKATAAKKVGAILGLSPDEVFNQSLTPAPSPEVTEPELVKHHQGVALEANVGSLSEMHSGAVVVPVEASVHADHLAAPAAISAPASITEEPKSKSSLWVIAGLFAAALAVAAYMQPRELPASEPAPPLQVLPIEEAASVASAADAPASEPVEVVSGAALVQKPASAAAITASATAAAASQAP
jgi:transcriptional regulator with XRE-family HTH domain